MEESHTDRGASEGFGKRTKAQEDGRGPGDIDTDIRCGLRLTSPALPHPHLPFQQKRKEGRTVRRGNNTELGEEVSSGNSPSAD